MLDDVAIHSISVLPIEPPQFVKRIENISSLQGGTVVFQATVKGSVPITISWLKDNDDIIEDDNTKMTFLNNVATLMIRAIEVKHDGKYFCQAKNEAGIQRCSALLTVKGLCSLLSVPGYTTLSLVNITAHIYSCVCYRTCHNR